MSYFSQYNKCNEIFPLLNYNCNCTLAEKICGVSVSKKNPPGGAEYSSKFQHGRLEKPFYMLLTHFRFTRLGLIFNQNQLKKPTNFFKKATKVGIKSTPPELSKQGRLF